MGRRALSERSLPEKRKILTSMIKARKDERRLIVEELRKRASASAKELSALTALDSWKVVSHLVALRKTGVVVEVGEKEGEYLYKLSKEKVTPSML